MPALDAEQASRIDMAVDALKEVPWEPEPIEHALEGVVERTGLSKNKLYTPIRLTLTGKKVSLPIHYTLALLPKEIAMTRLMRAVPA